MVSGSEMVMGPPQAEQRRGGLNSMTDQTVRNFRPHLEHRMVTIRTGTDTHLRTGMMNRPEDASASAGDRVAQGANYPASPAEWRKPGTPVSAA